MDKHEAFLIVKSYLPNPLTGSLLDAWDTIRTVLAESAPSAPTNSAMDAIELLRRWVGAVDGNWQISEITDDTRDFLAQQHHL